MNCATGFKFGGEAKTVIELETEKKFNINLYYFDTFFEVIKMLLVVEH